MGVMLYPYRKSMQQTFHIASVCLLDWSDHIQFFQLDCMFFVCFLMLFILTNLAANSAS